MTQESVKIESKDLSIRLASKQSHTDNQPDQMAVINSFAVSGLQLIADRRVDGLL